jgi:hypothetical protein
MELVLAGLVVLVAAGAVYYYTRKPNFDLNADGKVDTKDAAAAVVQVVEATKTAADVNKDGKVDVADAKAAVEKTKKTVAKKTTRKKKSA